MRLKISAFFAALFCATFLMAGDKDIAEKLGKDGVKVKLDNGAAVSVLFADKDMTNFAPTPAQFKLVGQLTQLKTLTVYNTCGATDESFSFIDKLENLETASINGLKLSDEGFKHLTRLKNLKKLTLWHCFNKQFNGSGSAY